MVGVVGNLNCHGLILMKEMQRKQYGQRVVGQEPVRVALPPVLLVHTQPQQQHEEFTHNN